MTIDTKTLREAAFRVIDEGGLAWFDAEQLGSKNGLDFPETDAQFIALASPRAVVDLIDSAVRQAAKIDAQAAEIKRLSDNLEIITLSVAASLDRHGVTEADDPGEAIDVLVADKDAKIKRLRAENERLLESLRWAAAVLQRACQTGSVNERDHFVLEGVSRTGSEVLDAADAALQESPS